MRKDIQMAYQSGRHFLQIPGPANVPDRVLRAMAAPTIDHRGRSPRTRVHRGSPAFQAVARNRASSSRVGAVAGPGLVTDSAAAAFALRAAAVSAAPAASAAMKAPL